MKKLSAILSSQSEQIIEDLFRIENEELKKINMNNLQYNTHLAFLFFSDNLINRRQYKDIKQLQDDYLYKRRFSDRWIEDILSGYIGKEME